MSYDDNVKGKLEFTRTEVLNEPVSVPQELIEQVEALGLTISGERAKPVTGLSQHALSILKADDDLNWWFILSSELADASDSESGRSRSLSRVINLIVDTAVADGCVVNGEIIIDFGGDTQISRYLVKNNTISYEDAKIVWSDGTYYNN